MAISSQPIQHKENLSWWLSLFFLCAILGALLGLSLKTQQTIGRQGLPSQSYSGLAEGYLVLKKDVNDQQRTIAALQQNTARLEQTSGSNNKQAQVLSDDLKQAKFLAGLTEVTGPGAIVTLNDSTRSAPATLPTNIPPPNLIHDTDINQTINELKAAGAEAVSVNNQRIVATTAVRCAGPTVYINSTPVTPPYLIRAIGDSKTLQDAINLPGGIADQMKMFDPAMLKTQRAATLIIPAYDGPTQPKYAKPVTGSEAETSKDAKG